MDNSLRDTLTFYEIHCKNFQYIQGIISRLQACISNKGDIYKYVVFLFDFTMLSHLKRFAFLHGSRNGNFLARVNQLFLVRIEFELKCF